MSQRVRWTEQQVLIVEQKLVEGMTIDDPNLKGKLLYIMEQDSTSTEAIAVESIWA